MATDVDVQYFSHLNGLTLGNNWGDLIRLLDKALVTGVDFTQITSASIDAQGDVHITLYAAHNAMLFQVVELTGFAPASLNQKYRIKGVPGTTQLILKPHTAITETSITTVGTGKLASLGYEIIFRDTGDVKRVYRAKNPTAQHPFIRVDETISGLSGNYDDTYAKSAMVGLLESMAHIDDYKDPNKLQLPLDVANFSKNWEIIGADSSVVRGWCKWFYAAGENATSITESQRAASGLRNFTLVGCADYFYLTPAFISNDKKSKLIYGCGLFDSSLPNSVVPNWFLMATQKTSLASAWVGFNNAANGYSPLINNAASSVFLTTKYNQTSPIVNSSQVNAGLINYNSGESKTYNNHIAAMQITVRDDYLRGVLHCVSWAGGLINQEETTPIFSDASMYIADTVSTGVSGYGGFYFYLGELE